ncbi:MAG TPA: dTDP-glucose 4,6-dehydratase [Chroococcales cyanobacterium]|jgi:dTDP-glucose 4,6-dehydratase
MKILVSGGCGFIGSNLIRHFVEKHPAYQILNLDLLTYCGNKENLAEIENHPHYTFVQGDICDRPLVDSLMSGVNAVLHLAAESHVDRSISDPEAFVRTNVMGTQILLDAAKKHGVERFVHVSTDEVYGSLGATGLFTEETPLAPNSPYSASKTSSDLFARAYWETFRFPTLITRCSNNYGPYQFPEKLIPFFVTNLVDGEAVPVYGDGMNVRDWLYVADHCSALDAVLHRGKPGEVYNIGGNNERTNMEITRKVLGLLGKGEESVRYVQDRPGHDRRYAIDSSKMQRELGWSPSFTFEKGIASTVNWYLENEKWWRPLKERALDLKRASENNMARSEK